jgi:hypothetical protein
MGSQGPESPTVSAMTAFYLDMKYHSELNEVDGDFFC